MRGIVDGEYLQGSLGDIFGHDQQGHISRPLAVDFKQFRHLVAVDQVPVGQEDVRGSEYSHAAGIVDELRPLVEPALELQPLGHLKRGLGGGRRVEGVVALDAGVMDSPADNRAHFRVPVGRHGGDRGQRREVRRVYGNGDAPEFGHDQSGSPPHAALESLRVGAGGDMAQALAVERAGEDGGCGRPVAGLGVGPLGDLLNKFDALVFPWVGDGNSLGHRHAVLGDQRRPDLPAEDHGVAAGSEG